MEKFDITRTVELIYTIREGVSTAEKYKGQIRWHIEDNLGMCLDHFATKDEAIAAVNSGDFDSWMLE